MVLYTIELITFKYFCAWQHNKEEVMWLQTIIVLDIEYQLKESQPVEIMGVKYITFYTEVPNDFWQSLKYLLARTHLQCWLLNF